MQSTPNDHEQWVEAVLRDFFPESMTNPQDNSQRQQETSLEQPERASA